ncbi:pentapeptide repeat-containing protein [Deinococcus sp. QL22]|uniref:pentapeptide repeat-containing protein n=1 Tax=Deinococcus sp. QL22 TaxID=2939437 RepID=UPI00353018BA
MLPVRQSLSAEQVVPLILAGQPLSNLNVIGSVVLIISDDYVLPPVSLTNCHFQRFNASITGFSGPVTFQDCRFDEARFFGTYFLGGARFINCIFTGEVDFSAGGHNTPPAEVVLEHCEFRQYVDFFDVWYTGPVRIQNCRFLGGTNLLIYLSEPYGSTLEYPPLVLENQGDLGLERH